VAQTQALLAHEAAHVIGGLLAGQHVKEVRLGATKRNPRNAATTTFDLDGDVDLYGRLVATLMGPMAEGAPPPAWPPLPDLVGHNDEHICAVLVAHLKLSKAEYVAAVALAAHQLDDPLVKAAIAQVAHALGQHSVLPGQQIEELLGPNMVAWLEHGEDSLCSS
jgi:hypothetical protein